MTLEEKHELSELLAIIHRDGGHHESKVGTAQAIRDAVELMHKRWVINEEYERNEL